MEIGEYVRTKEGHIHKITSQLAIDMLMFTKEIDPIVKHSKNIIDLIEVGDYVNDEIVIDISERGLYLGIGYDEEYSRTYIDEKDIRTILTHEQYEGNSYKVVE